MKFFISTILASFIFLGSHTETRHSVKKRVLDRAIYKSLKIEDYELDHIKGLTKNPGQFYSIYSSSSELGYLYIGKVESCRIGGCTAVGYEESEIDLMNEYFNYFIVIDKTLTVRNVKIYDYNATYGYEICSPLWLRKFNGLSAQNSIVLGEDIDAISGATISSQALVDDLTVKIDMISTFISEQPLSQE